MLVNVRVRKKAALADIAPIKKVIDEVEVELAGKGRVLVRYSGTEPLLRVMIEGPDQLRITELADSVAEAVREHLGV